MVQFCFQYYWISSYQSDPSADGRRYKVWKNLLEGATDLSKAEILIGIDTWKKGAALSRFPGFMAWGQYRMGWLKLP